MGIRLLAMDVDGTMTDGKIYIGPSGETMKAFNVKDGQGITLLHKAGIVTAIITARESAIVANRAQELGIREVHQGKSDKLEVMREIAKRLDLSPEEIAYIGDDVTDLPVLRFAGLSLCPADSVPEVKQTAGRILPSRGGEGAIRDAAELILSMRE